MTDKVLKFLKRHSSLALTTHEGPDADALGAELVFAQICRELGKKVRILNTAPAPARYAFMDPHNEIEVWNASPAMEIPKNTALVILDTADEYNIGRVREFVPQALEVFIIDHHEPNRFSNWEGYIDSAASSTCEMIIEIANAAGVVLNRVSAAAAYAGIIYDTGSFAYSKTTARTFRAALALVEAGVNPYAVYHELHETASMPALLLQKRVLSTLELLGEGRVAVQILRKEDLEASRASFEDAENFVNIPLRSRDIAVSVLVKENQEGQIRCSLRSKGQVNVSKIAQAFGGGGHVSAAGFRSKDGIEETLSGVLEKITALLDNGKPGS
jgi:phosphoesterase RecJ-like protein